MAVIADATKSLQLLVEEEVAALQFNQYPVLNRLQKRVTSQKTIKWNANVGGATVVGEATTASVSTYSEDVVKGASLAIGSNRFRSSFQVQKEDLAEAASAGKGALRDLFGYEIQSGMRAILETLSGRIYTGTGLATHGGVIGLGSIVANAAYAGIDPATDTAWSCYVNTNASNRALTSALLSAMEVNVKTVKFGNYTAIYTTPSIVERYKDLFAANNSIINQLPAGVADLGYTGVTYLGRPLIGDPYCPANTMYFVNEPELALYTFRQNNTSSDMGMQFAITKIENTNPDAENYAITLKAQLKAHNRPKAVAMLEKITE
ncbi:phage major capsid protein [Calothrix membranacea FACHB-236]|nr:phage major capsid protein [Calothrix membranacea FACHB-236]